MDTTEKKYRTDFLFATTGFTMGAGSVLNLAGNYFSFNGFESSEMADFRAIESDWGVVGQDIKCAASQMEKKSKQGKLMSNGK